MVVNDPGITRQIVAIPSLTGKACGICRGSSSEAQLDTAAPCKPAELTDEGDNGLVVIMVGSDEPLGVADVFDVKADADSNPGLIEAVREAG